MEIHQKIKVEMEEEREEDFHGFGNELPTSSMMTVPPPPIPETVVFKIEQIDEPEEIHGEYEEPLILNLKQEDELIIEDSPIDSNDYSSSELPGDYNHFEISSLEATYNSEQSQGPCSNEGRFH